MNCRYCGTRLIPGAMFCGECGRSVAASAAAPAAAPLLPSPVGGPEFSHATAEESTPVAMASPRTFSHCPQCGSPMAADDIFCGECGFVARTVLAPVATTGENDTVAITADPELLLRTLESEVQLASGVGPEPEPEPEPEHAPGRFEVPAGYKVMTGSADGAGRAVGVVVAKFNGEITSRLL